VPCLSSQNSKHPRTMNRIALLTLVIATLTLNACTVVEYSGDHPPIRGGFTPSRGPLVGATFVSPMLALPHPPPPRVRVVVARPNSGPMYGGSMYGNSRTPRYYDYPNQPRNLYDGVMNGPYGSYLPAPKGPPTYENWRRQHGLPPQ
jgi:hypothetical protein